MEIIKLFCVIILTTMTQNQNDACNSAAYLNAIDQRKRQQLFNVPPIRYEVIFNPDTNPYLTHNFTKFDLDMRRKAEILKYAPNKRTQTNNLTRSQRWAQIVSGSYSRRTYSQSFIQENTLPNGQLQVCPQIQTPTSSSDVPGSNIMLYEDDNVPIYNYSKNDVYGKQPKLESTNSWDIIPYSDVFILSSTLTSPIYSTFTTLRMSNVPNPTYTYTIDVPLTVYVQSDVSYNGFSTVHYVDPSAVQLWLSSSALTVYYSTSPIAMIETPIFQLISNYDVNNRMNISTNMTIYPKSNSNYTNPTKNKFFAYSYFGILRISNLKLQAQPEYIYDIKLAVNFNSSLSNNYSTYFGFKNPTIGVYMNTSYATTQKVSQNCHVSNPIPITEANLPTFKLSGY